MDKNINCQYALILSKIKQFIDESQSNDQTTFIKLDGLIKMMEQEQWDPIKICHVGGRRSYRHNKNLFSELYLIMGQYYDFMNPPEILSPEQAKKFYLLSEQPPAKWRLARLYITHRVQCDGDINNVSQHLITEAIQQLIHSECDPSFLIKRLEYLSAMYHDLYVMVLHETVSIYFEILQWIIKHHAQFQSEYHQLLCGLYKYDIPCQSRHDRLIKRQLVDLIHQT